jgi:hypothetical protein
MRRTVDMIGGECRSPGADRPFTTASFLVSAEALGRLMIRRPRFAHRLCELA